VVESADIEVDVVLKGEADEVGDGVLGRTGEVFIRSSATIGVDRVRRDRSLFLKRAEIELLVKAALRRISDQLLRLNLAFIQHTIQKCSDLSGALFRRLSFGG
jgi:hypothetical protein